MAGLEQQPWSYDFSSRDDVQCPKLKKLFKKSTAQWLLNVILELGYFFAKLKREKTFILKIKDDDIEMPSDLRGIIYGIMDGRGEWKLKLARELRAVGFDVEDGLSLILEKCVKRPARPGRSGNLQ
ncbi:hypothetical protein AGMMS50248_04620 [Deltaproteobacteria bacterium]|nr:hypothetical protein AGMMS50248_04620 [Deltaproteobacteria bacterium]